MGVAMGKKHDRLAKRAAAKTATADASMPQPVAKVARAKKEKATPRYDALPALPRNPSKRKAAEKHPCTCGCGNLTGGTWVPGHDARAKGWALRIERGLLKLTEVPANEQAGAKHMLKVRKAAGETAPKVSVKLIKGEATAAADAASAEEAAKEDTAVNQ